MSKKKKFKKNFRAEIFKQLNNDNQVSAGQDGDDLTLHNNIDITKTKNTDLSIKFANHDVAKKDLLRIAWIMLLILIVLSAIVIIDNKTNYIKDFANYISDFSHLNK